MPGGGSARPPSERREALKEVLAQARSCERCSELAASRRTVVFGAGNADAELMFVGEAPGASEDEQGLPFVGRAGKLLEELLAETGLERREVFVANVLKSLRYTARVQLGTRSPHSGTAAEVPSTPAAICRPLPSGLSRSLLQAPPARLRDARPARDTSRGTRR